MIADSAWEQQTAQQDRERLTIGVNAHADDDRSTGGIELFALDPQAREKQLERLAQTKRGREERRAAEALRSIEGRAGDLRANLMREIEEAVRARCTVGEICDTLRSVWGVYAPPREVF